MSVLFNLDTRQHEHVRVTTLHETIIDDDDNAVGIPQQSSTETSDTQISLSPYDGVITAASFFDFQTDDPLQIAAHQPPQSVDIMFSPSSQSSLSSAPYLFTGNSDSPSCTTDNSDSNSSTTFELKNMDLNADTTVPFVSVPHLVIHEQPVDKFRFRYKSEMHGTHGSLTGASSGKKKTFPAVELQGFVGAAIIRCSLHQTDDHRDRLHSHSLVVRRDNEDCRDPHDVVVNTSVGFRAEFPGMGIIHTAKRFIVDELYDKLLERHQLINTMREATQLERERVRLRAETESKQMNLNQVCLCFEAFRQVNDQFERLCEPVYSRPINNMKSALTGELKITRLSATCCDAAGNSDLFLFVEKVGKKNIQVRFYEEDENKDMVWQAFGHFAESDVHHQYAIALRTPPYYNKDIEEKVNVFVQLYRKSDHCYSDPVPFHYKPRSSTVTRKRARMCSTFNSADLPTVLPTVLNNLNDTISTEYNKSAMIKELMGKPSEELLLMAKPSEEMLLMEYVQDHSKEFEDLMDLNELRQDGGNGDGTRENRIEARVTLLRQQIDRVAQSQSRQKARDYLEHIWKAPNVKVDILNLALTEECGDRTAHTVIDMLVQYELTALLNWPDESNHYTALHTACLFGRAASIAKMLRLGANPNAPDRDNNTPLHLAVKYAFVTCVSAICDAANYPTAPSTHALHIDATNNDGYTALHLAIREKHVDMVQILTAAGASAAKREARQGDNCLHMAVTCNSTDIVAHLLATTDVDMHETNISNLTPLELAGMDVNVTESGILELLRCDGGAMAAANAAASSISTPKRRAQQQMGIAVAVPKIEVDAHPTTSSRAEPLFDAICLNELCNLFNLAERWKLLAAELHLDDFVGQWQDAPNPTLKMFQFVEMHGFQLQHMVRIFVDMDHHEALSLLDGMIARRMEKEV